MSHFIDVIAQCIPGETAALELINPFIKQRSIQKNEFLLQAGAARDYMIMGRKRDNSGKWG